MLKQTEPEKWLNNGGCDFAVMLRPPGVEDIMSKILTAESEYTHWGLVPRFMLANETLDAADAAGMTHLSIMAVAPFAVSLSRDWRAPMLLDKLLGSCHGLSLPICMSDLSWTICCWHPTAYSRQCATATCSCLGDCLLSRACVPARAANP